MEESLIPGLPDDVARECLARVPYGRWRAAGAVCRRWREEMAGPEFDRVRRAAGMARPVVAFSQSEPVAVLGRDPAKKCAFGPAHRVALLEPESGSWCALPAVPGLPLGLPLFCQLAAAGRRLVVVGGWDPESWLATDAVFVYDFLSGSWRRGRAMPGPRRSFFACASDGRRTVYVAGGHDEDKSALRSALAYDVEADEWARLPDMARERDEPKGLFRGGRFHVVGGYCTESQGRFGRSSEALDPAARRWGPVEEDALEPGACPRTCVAWGEGKMYRCRVGNVAVMEEAEKGTWRQVAELPREARVMPHVVACSGGVLVIGAPCHGGAHVGYVLDSRAGYSWRPVPVPEEFSGQVQAACSLDM
ncbi:F-box/kelch-repeat protein At1g80440-like [Wolffia australiana]